MPQVLHAGHLGSEGGRMHGDRGALRPFALRIRVDVAGHLVPGNQRFAHHEGAVGAVEVVVQV